MTTNLAMRQRLARSLMPQREPLYKQLRRDAAAQHAAAVTRVLNLNALLATPGFWRSVVLLEHIVGFEFDGMGRRRPAPLGPLPALVISDNISGTSKKDGKPDNPRFAGPNRNLRLNPVRLCAHGVARRTFFGNRHFVLSAPQIERLPYSTLVAIESAALQHLHKVDPAAQAGTSLA